MTGETIYFAASGEEFLQFSMKVILQFIGKGEGADLMGEISSRILEKRGNLTLKKKALEKRKSEHSHPE